MEDTPGSVFRLTASVVAAFVANQKISSTDIPGLIAAVDGALRGLMTPEAAAPEAHSLTAGQIRKSITPDFLISFEDGKGYKTLKRHLTMRGMTLSDYKAKWGLPSDYPTTSPAYSAKRSAMAKSLGFGLRRRKPATAISEAGAATEQPAPSARPARSNRRMKPIPAAS